MSLDELINKLSKHSLNYYDFLQKIDLIKEFDDYKDIDPLDLLNTFGIEIKKMDNKKISLATSSTLIKDQIFCAVDIECSAPLPNGQIIEIAGVKFKNDKIIDSFNSLINCDFLPEVISDLTNINQSDLDNAPNLKQVMYEFRNFLGTSVFVAHNAKFDYDFISNTLKNLGFGILLNRKICTIELSRKILKLPKYGLESLKEFLNIDTTHHRALPDALACKEIFSYCTNGLRLTTEELINFSKSAKPIYKN